MSFRIDTIRCDKCDFSQFGFFTSAVQYLYLFPDGSTVDIEKDTGWCYKCRKLSIIENISLEFTEKQLKEFITQRSQKELTYNKIRNANLISRIFDPKKNQINELQKELESIEKKIWDTTVRLNMLRSRKSPPKCLQCSGINFVVIRIPPFPDHFYEQKIIGFTHPECGGNFTVDFNNTFPVRSSQKYYTFEGIPVVKK